VGNVTFSGLNRDRRSLRDSSDGLIASVGSDRQALLDQRLQPLLAHRLASASATSDRTPAVLEELLAAEVLVIGVLDPALAQTSSESVIGCLRMAAPHQSRRHGGWPGSSCKTSPKRPSRNPQSTSAPASTADAHVDDLIEAESGTDPARPSFAFPCRIQPPLKHRLEQRITASDSTESLMRFCRKSTAHGNPGKINRRNPKLSCQKSVRRAEH